MGAAERDDGNDQARTGAAADHEAAIREALGELADDEAVDRVLRRALDLADCSAVPDTPRDLARFVDTHLAYAAETQLGAGAGRLLTRHLADLWAPDATGDAAASSSPFAAPPATGPFPRADVDPPSTVDGALPTPAGDDREAAPPASGTRRRSDASAASDAADAAEADGTGDAADGNARDATGPRPAVDPSSAVHRPGSEDLPEAADTPAPGAAEDDDDEAELDLAPASAAEQWSGDLPLEARNDTPSRTPAELEALAVAKSGFRKPGRGLPGAIAYFLHTYGRRDVLGRELRTSQAALEQARFDLALRLGQVARAVAARVEAVPEDGARGPETRRELQAVARLAGRFATVARQDGASARLAGLAELLRSAPGTAAPSAMDASRRAQTLRALARGFTRVSLRAREERLGDLAGATDSLDLAFLELAGLEERGVILALAREAHDAPTYRRGRSWLIAGTCLAVGAAVAAVIATVLG